MGFSIGVDIGGTKIAIAIVNQNGVIVAQKTLETDKTARPEHIIDHINYTISYLIRSESLSFDDINGIGVGSPGPLDIHRGEITCPPNLPLWKDVPIVRLMEDYFDSIPVKLENDANAAAMAEKWLGAGIGLNHFAYVTVSTGIGSGIVINGELLHGMHGNAGDIGHMVVDPAFGLCTCGQMGCLEVIASGTAIANSGSAIMGRNLTTEDVFNLYEKEEPAIVEHVNTVLKHLGAGCVTLINTFDTEAIIIGGGVSKAGDLLFKTLEHYVQQYALNPRGRQTSIIPAKLEERSGVIGAGALFH